MAFVPSLKMSWTAGRCRQQPATTHCPIARLQNIEQLALSYKFATMKFWNTFHFDVRIEFIHSSQSGYGNSLQVTNVRRITMNTTKRPFKKMNKLSKIMCRPRLTSVRFSCKRNLKMGVLIFPIFGYFYGVALFSGCQTWDDQGEGGIKRLEGGYKGRWSFLLSLQKESSAAQCPWVCEIYVTWDIASLLRRSSEQDLYKPIFGTLNNNLHLMWKIV